MISREKAWKIGAKVREIRGGMRSELWFRGKYRKTVYSFAHGGPDGGYRGVTVRVGKDLVDVILEEWIRIPGIYSLPEWYDSKHPDLPRGIPDSDLSEWMIYRDPRVSRDYEHLGMDRSGWSDPAGRYPDRLSLHWMIAPEGIVQILPLE